jgi:hypothetical protein
VVDEYCLVIISSLRAEEPSQPLPVDKISVAAFITSLFSLAIVSIPLAIVGIQRTSNHARRGRALAVASIVIIGVWIVLGVVAAAILLASSTVTTGATANPAVAETPPAPTPAVLTSTTPTANGATLDHQPTGPLKKKKRVYWEELKTNDCVTFSSDAAVYVTVVDCRVAHREQVMANLKLPGTRKYPGESAVDDAADTRCVAEFAKFVGVSFDDSQLEYSTYTTTREGWVVGDRTALCTVFDPAHRTTTKSFRNAHV